MKRSEAATILNRIFSQEKRKTFVLAPVPTEHDKELGDFLTDGATTKAGDEFETFGLLEFVEISNDEAIHLEVGDVLRLPEMDITIIVLGFIAVNFCRMGIENN